MFKLILKNQVKLGYSILLVVFIVLSCGKQSTHTNDEPKISKDSVQKEVFRIQVVAVGNPDSTHLLAAFETLEDYFSNTQISFANFQIELTDSMELVKGKTSASKILKVMKPLKADSINSLIGITEVNIAKEKRTLSDGRTFKNWSILGMGSLKNGVCVVSYKRLPNIDHFSKTVVHEFGHTLGLSHCPERYCIMVDGDGSSKPIKESKGFCDSCQAKVNVETLAFN